MEKKILEAIPLKSRIRQRNPLSPGIFYIIHKALADTIRKGFKLPLFADDISNPYMLESLKIVSESFQKQ